MEYWLEYPPTHVSTYALARRYTGLGSDKDSAKPTKQNRNAELEAFFAGLDRLTG